MTKTGQSVAVESVGTMLTDKEHLASLAAYSGDPSTPANPYFAVAEKYADSLWKNLVWPFISDCDFANVLDLAAGHGRNSKFLLDIAQRLTITDIQPGNIDVCRKRFVDFPQVLYYVTNGYDFQPVADDTLTFIYCFDSMVHFDSDVVRAYLRDARRVLRQGGRGFFHHSNYTQGYDWRRNPHSRNFLSKQLFEHYALKEGLVVIRQKTINWGSAVGLDCLSLVEKPH
jgi:SAM-dependent methyltransferase